MKCVNDDCNNETPCQSINYCEECMEKEELNTCGTKATLYCGGICQTKAEEVCLK